MSSFTVKKEEGLVRELEIKVPANEFLAAHDKKLTEVAKNIKIQGFRPGKVPLKIVKQKHGSQILGEVLETIVSESSQKAIDELKLTPATQPKIEIAKDFDPTKEDIDLTYTMLFEIYSDVPEIDFKKLTGENFTVDVSEKDIEDGLTKIAGNQKSFGKLKRSRKAKKGDAVRIDFVGKLNGETFEGGSGEDVQLELGSGQFIPGFEDQLIGAKKEEDILVKVTFPTEYGADNLAGKEAEFEVKVHEVLEAKEVEINDEFATKMGVENLDRLKDLIKSQIEGDFKKITRTKIKKDIFDYLDENCKFDVPNSMVQGEFETILKGTEQEKKEEKVTDEQKSEFKVIAERRVRLGIILAELARKNSIEISKEELQGALMDVAAMYRGQEKQIFDYYSKNKQALDSLKGPILEEKVVDFIVDNSSFEEVKKTTDELLELEKELSDE